MTAQQAQALARMDDQGNADITKFSPEQYNVLAPISNVGRTAEYVQQSAAVVKLDADPNKGDCYAAPGTRWEKDRDGNLLPVNVAPAKPGLMKLAAAMGIVWRVEQIKPRSHQLVADMAGAVGANGLRELFEQVRYDVAYRAQIAVRDGLQWRFLEASYEWELESQTRKVRKEARKKAADAKKYNKPEIDEEAYVEERLDQIISDRHALAESKAILRAIRATGIRQQYLRSEFGKPFVVQRVDLKPDLSDPAVRAAIAQKAVQSGSEIFGGSTPVAAALPAAVAEVPDFETAEREGKVERIAPQADDTIEADVLPDAVPADEGWPSDDDVPTRGEVCAEVIELWEKCKAAVKAGAIAEMPPAPPSKDAPLDDLQDWCEKCRGFLGAVAEAVGGAA